MIEIIGSTNKIDLDFRDLLLQNLPFYVNLAAESTKAEVKEFLAEAFVGKIKNSSLLRHGKTTPCVTSMQCDVNAVQIPFPRDNLIHHTIYWKLSVPRRILTVNAMALGFDNKIFNYFNTHDELLQTITETDGRLKADYSRILRYFRFGTVVVALLTIVDGLILEFTDALRMKIVFQTRKQ